ncbi:MAG: hypothetical protein ACRDI2_19600 [Chloroflexota bacterium]
MTDQPPAPQSAASLIDAVAAFLGGAAPAPGYVHPEVGAYRALYRQAAGQPDRSDDLERAGSAGAPSGGTPLLLAGSDGAVFVPQWLGGASDDHDSGSADGADLAAALRQRRLRPTGSTLALRLPLASAGGAPRMVTFTLWASPAYLASNLASGAEADSVWK